jgi:hypothetical protein
MAIYVTFSPLLQLIKNVHKHDAVLHRIPAFEKAVSRVLRDIKVVRRYVFLVIEEGSIEVPAELHTNLPVRYTNYEIPSHILYFLLVTFTAIPSVCIIKCAPLQGSFLSYLFKKLIGLPFLFL